MKIFFVLFYLIEFLFSKVTDIEPSTYEDFKYHNEQVLMLYYADTSQGRKLKNEFALLEKQLSNSFPNIKIGQMLLNNDKKIQKAFKLNSIPTIIFYRKDNKNTYGGSPNSLKMLEWIEKIVKKAHPYKYSEIRTDEDKKAFVSKNNGWVLYFGDNSGPEFKLFEKLSKKFSFLNFGYASNNELFQEFRVPNVSKCILTYHPEEKSLFYYGVNTKKAWEEKELINYIKAYTVKNFFEVDIKGLDDFRVKREAVMLLVYAKENNSETDEIKTFKKTRLRMKGEVPQLFINGLSEDGKKLMRITNISHSELPVLMMINHTTFPPKRYIMETKKEKNDFTVDNILVFYDNFLHGLLMPKWISEPIPEEKDNMGIVKKLVGLNFETVVKDQMKNVFVLFYSDSDTKSSNFRKEFHKIASKFSDVQDLVFGELNTRNNEVESINLSPSKLPAMALYKKDNKNPSFLTVTKENFIIDFLDQNLGKGKIDKKEL